MKENLDPHQVTISREYFDKLVALAKPNDHLAGRKDHPNQTIVSRILWHARKYNRPLHTERVAEVAREHEAWRVKRQQAITVNNVYNNLYEWKPRKKVYVLYEGVYCEAVVRGINPRNKTQLFLMVLGPKWKNKWAVDVNDVLFEKPVAP